MLARERRWPADTAADGCTELAAALAALPSRPLEMVADAVAALDCDEDEDEDEDVPKKRKKGQADGPSESEEEDGPKRARKAGEQPPTAAAALATAEARPQRREQP